MYTYNSVTLKNRKFICHILPPLPPYIQLHLQASTLVQKLKILKPILPEEFYREPKARLEKMLHSLIADSIRDFAGRANIIDSDDTRQAILGEADQNLNQPKKTDEDKKREAEVSCTSYLGRKDSYFDEPLGK